jgi:hypothetical protein
MKKWVMGIIVTGLVLGILLPTLQGYFETWMKENESSIKATALQTWQSHRLVICVSIATLILGVAIVELLVCVRRKDAEFKNIWRVWRRTKDITPSCFRIQGYKEQYVPREGNRQIEDCLARGRSVLITGKQKIGKTRPYTSVIFSLS